MPAFGSADAAPAYLPVPLITVSGPTNEALVVSVAAVVRPEIIRTPLVAPSENVKVMKPKNSPLPFR